MRWSIFAALALVVMLTAGAVAQSSPTVNVAAISAERPPQLLSAYGFFRDAGAREPVAGVTPYDLNTPL